MRQPWVPATLRRNSDDTLVAELPARVPATNPNERQAAPGNVRTLTGGGEPIPRRRRCAICPQGRSPRFSKRHPRTACVDYALS